MPLKISICIATYKRPKMLEKLLDSIFACSMNRQLVSKADIIVVDNDAQCTARETVEGKSIPDPVFFSLQYGSNPAKGITNVRNDLLSRADAFNPDFIVFVDDDEWVTEQWLNELVRTITERNADAAMGPVLPVFEKPLPDYVACWFNRESHEDQSKIDAIKTGNLILRASKLRELKLRFDSRFNITGSSDTYFGIQLQKSGSEIYWAAKAIAYETVPASRATMSWVIKRVYRGASTYTYMLKLEKKWGALIRKFFVSILYIFIGLITSVLVIVPFRKRYWGILKLVNGVGGITGLGNLLYNEYK